MKVLNHWWIQESFWKSCTLIGVGGLTAKKKSNYTTGQIDRSQIILRDRNKTHATGQEFLKNVLGLIISCSRRAARRSCSTTSGSSAWWIPHCSNSLPPSLILPLKLLPSVAQCYGSICYHDENESQQVSTSLKFCVKRTPSPRGVSMPSPSLLCYTWSAFVPSNTLGPSGFSSRSYSKTMKVVGLKASGEWISPMCLCNKHICVIGAQIVAHKNWLQNSYNHNVLPSSPLKGV